VDDPDLGHWTYAYDGAGRLSTQTDARGVVTALNYDELSNVMRKCVSEGGIATEIAANTYHDARTGTFNKGKLTTARRGVTAVGGACSATPGARTTRFYDCDAAGRLALDRHEHQIGTSPRTLAFKYWPNGAVKRKQMVDGTWTGEHGYDAAGRLSSLDNAQGTPAASQARRGFPGRPEPARPSSRCIAPFIRHAPIPAPASCLRPFPRPRRTRSSRALPVWSATSPPSRGASPRRRSPVSASTSMRPCSARRMSLRRRWCNRFSPRPRPRSRAGAMRRASCLGSGTTSSMPGCSEPGKPIATPRGLAARRASAASSAKSRGRSSSRCAAGLDERNAVTPADIFGRPASRFAGAADRPFDHAAVDEAQDLGVAEARFLGAPAGGRPDGLFFTGDLGQRIFQQPFSWKSLGIDVRGRSFTLRVNHRASQQIRSHADRLLPQSVSDVDGNAESRRGTVSVFSGPAPDVPVFATREAERAAVAAWNGERLREGCRPHELAVFVRSPAQLTRAEAALGPAQARSVVVTEEIEAEAGSIALCTMHLAKGLEFRAVTVMACDDVVVPLQERIETVADDADLQDVYDTERHLLYVACTRARDRLLVTGVAPASEFLGDLLKGETVS
jgi:YD repeat-containing protein